MALLEHSLNDTKAELKALQSKVTTLDHGKFCILIKSASAIEIGFIGECVSIVHFASVRVFLL